MNKKIFVSNAPSSSKVAGTLPTMDSMKSTTYADELVTNLNNLRENDELCDFTVSAEGTSIKVHKTLLAATSDYFRAMLQGAMKESQEDRVDLKGLTASALKSIVEFLYSGHMVIDADNLTELLNAASHLQIKTALDLCSDYINSMLSFTTAQEFLCIADTYSLTKVNQFYENEVLNNFEEFSRTELFTSLPAQDLSRFISSNHLLIRSEFLLHELLVLWYSQDKARATQVEKLLGDIRFALMSSEQLNILQTRWPQAQYPIIHNYITQGIHYHMECQRGHPTLSKFSELRSTKPSMIVVHHGTANNSFKVTSLNRKNDCFYELLTDMSLSRDCRVDVLDNFIFISRVVDCGGGTLLSSLLRVDPRHQCVQELTPCRNLHLDPAFVAKDLQLYLFGGINENYAVLDSVDCYNVKTDKWCALLPLPQPTHSLAACAYKSKIYLSGGVTAHSRYPSASLTCFDPETQHWDSTRAPMHCSRRLHEMLAVEHKLYVVGGLSVQSQDIRINMECYDIDTDQWTLLTHTLSGRSVGHITYYEDDKLISIGREHYEATEDDIWTYDIKKDVWTNVKKYPYRSGLGASSCVMAHINFADEMVSKKAVSNKR